MAFPAGRPCITAICRKAFADPVKGSGEHPQTAISLFNDHVLVKAAMRNIRMAAKCNGASLI